MYESWMPCVDNPVTYPVDCVYMGRGPYTIDWYKPGFESMVSEQKGLCLKYGFFAQIQVTARQAFFIWIQSGCRKVVWRLI